MSHHSFRELGVSPPVVDALAARSIHDPFDDPGARPAGRARRARHPRQVADRLRQDARVRGADRRARRRRRTPAPRRSSSSRPASSPRRSRDELEPARPGQGAHASRPCTAGSRSRRRRSAPRRRTSSSRRRAGSRISSSGGSSTSRRSGSSSSTRPTGCSTWASSRRSTRSCAALPRNRQTMFFSATLDGAVGELARAYTNSPSRFEPGRPRDRRAGDIEHSLRRRSRSTRSSRRSSATSRSPTGLTLVFVRTKRGADQLVKKLARQQVDAVAMHGDMSQRARERALERFETGKVKTLVATDVAARGLDLDDITHVINYDPPAEHTSYVHRTGRTGRAGRSGSAITFVLPDQQAETSHVARPPRARREVRGSRPALCAPEARVLRAPPPELEVVAPLADAQDRIPLARTPVARRIPEGVRFAAASCCFRPSR